MRCDHQVVSEHLMDYLEGDLSPSVKQQFEQVLSQCTECQKVYQRALSIQQVAYRWKNQAVPDWHRTAYAVKPRQSSHSWLSWTALATSTLAILMVVFQVNFQINHDGFQVAFGNQSSAQFEKLLTERFAQFEAQQKNEFDQRLASETEKLNTNYKLAMSTLLEKTREERRDDLNFLVTGIQSQRMQDRQSVDRKLTALADNQIENNQYLNQLIQSANLSKGEK